MSLVNNYVDKLYENAKQNDQQTLELKEETSNHLNESINDLMRHGYAYTDAYNIAIERFGGAECIESLLKVMKIKQAKFAHRLLMTGLYIIFISIILFAVTLFLGNKYDATYANIAYKLEQINTFNDKSNILKNETLILQAGTGLQNRDYFYSKELGKFIPSIFKSDLLYGNNNYYVSLKVLDLRKVGLISFGIGLTTYHILFSIWAIVHFYTKERVKLWEVISIVFLNIFGYLFVTVFNKIGERKVNELQEKSDYSTF